jgi:gliding motility-associated-like protein
MSPKGQIYVTAGSTNFLHVVNDPSNFSSPNIILNGINTNKLVLGGISNLFYGYNFIAELEYMNPNGTQQICYNTTTTLGGNADSIHAIYSWTGQIFDGSGNWTTPSSSYLVNPNVTNPTTIPLTSPVTRFLLTILNSCGDTIFTDKEFVYLDSLSTPIISGNTNYCAGSSINQLISTPPITGNINWYTDAALTNFVGSGTTFTPSNSIGSITYYVVEQETVNLAPQVCTSPITPVTVTISPQAPLCYTKQAAKWYFGDSLGLNFLCSSPPTPLNDGIAEGYSGPFNNNLEGTASISDVNGDLLFYAFDTYVVNRNHTVMPNGNGMACNFSSSQGYVVVPDPSNANKYYLFTVDALGGNAYYSEIDMTLNGGLGDVVVATKNTLLRTSCSEHITAVESCNGEIWVVVHDINNFYSYLVSSSGISPAVISPTIPLFNSAGQMMLSPTGRHLAISRDNGNCELFTFDNENGKICHKETLSQGGMGCSFSNNGQFLYVNGMFSGMYQYNVFAANVNASGIQIYDPFVSNGYIYGTMQLGPDCKLYTFGNGNTNGSVINSPNSSGLACNFQPLSFPLSDVGRMARFGLPNYIQSWFKDPTYVEPVIVPDFTFLASCPGNATSFTNTSSTISDCPNYLWNFGDPLSGVLDTSSLENPSHIYALPGTYTVSLTVSERCQSVTTTYAVTISPTTPPIIFTPDSWYCMGDNITPINTSNGTHWYSDAALTTLIGTGTSLIPTSTPGIITYYVINDSSGCISSATSVNVEFVNCPNTCSGNLISNGSFENYSACPTNANQLSNATGWLGSGAYYNTFCFGYYNSPSYYPYFDANNYNLGLNGGGTFPPPTGDGYAGIILGGTIFKNFLVQQEDLGCSKEYTLEFRATTPRSDTPPDNTLCVYGSNVAPPYFGCDPSLTLLGCLANPSSIDNYWKPHSITFIPPADFTYMVISGQCPTATGHGGTVLIDDITLCGNCVNNPVVNSINEITPESCAGNDGELSSTITTCSGTISYEWENLVNPGIVISTSTGITGLQAGNYQLTLTDFVGCTGSLNGTLNFSGSSNNSITYAGSPYCTNATSASVTLTGVAGGIYTAPAGLIIDSNTGTINPSLSTIGVYVVSYDDGFCITTTSVEIVAAPNASIIYNGTTFCTTSISELVMLNGTTGGTYSSTAGLTINASTGEINPSLSTPGTYIVTYTVPSSGGCPAFSTTASVIISPNPNATIDYGSIAFCETSSPVSVNLSGTSGGTFSSTSGLSLNAVTGEIDPSLSNPGNYVVSYTVPASNGCPSFTTTSNISISEMPSASITGDTVICQGENTVLTANGSGTFYWSDGSTGNTLTISPSSSQNITLYVTNGACIDSTTIPITVNNSPTVAAIANPTQINLGDSTLLEVLTNGSSILWSPISSISCGTCSSTIASPLISTIYSVLVTSSEGCVSTDTVLVIVDIVCGDLFTPDAFSPNGDGDNDFWCVYGNCISKLTVQIYDRWGVLVFESTSPSQCWNGEVNGKIADTGVFIYQMNATLYNGTNLQTSGAIHLRK